MADEEIKPNSESSPKGDPKGGEQQSDIDKLRSIKDREIAELRQSMAQMQQQMSQLQTPREAAALLKDLEDLDALAEENPKAAIDRAKQVAAALAGAVVSERNTRRFVDAQAKDFAATAKALELAGEFGGDPQVYKAELLKARTLDEMTLAQREKALELRDKKAGAPKSASRREVDDGAGRPAVDERLKIRQELNAIDVSTPEGLAEFSKKERELKARIDALSR